MSTPKETKLEISDTDDLIDISNTNGDRMVIKKTSVDGVFGDKNSTIIYLNGSVITINGQYLDDLLDCVGLTKRTS